MDVPISQSNDARSSVTITIYSPSEMLSFSAVLGTSCSTWWQSETSYPDSFWRALACALAHGRNTITRSTQSMRIARYTCQSLSDFPMPYANLKPTMWRRIHASQQVQSRSYRGTKCHACPNCGRTKFGHLIELILHENAREEERKETTGERTQNGWCRRGGHVNEMLWLKGPKLPKLPECCGRRWWMVRWPCTQ